MKNILVLFIYLLIPLPSISSDKISDEDCETIFSAADVVGSYIKENLNRSSNAISLLRLFNITNKEYKAILEEFNRYKIEEDEIRLIQKVPNSEEVGVILKKLLLKYKGLEAKVETLIEDNNQNMEGFGYSIRNMIVHYKREERKTDDEIRLNEISKELTNYTEQLKEMMGLFRNNSLTSKLLKLKAQIKRSIDNIEYSSMMRIYSTDRLYIEINEAYIELNNQFLEVESNFKRSDLYNSDEMTEKRYEEYIKFKSDFELLHSNVLLLVHSLRDKINKDIDMFYLSIREESERERITISRPEKKEASAIIKYLETELDDFRRDHSFHNTLKRNLNSLAEVIKERLDIHFEH